MVRCGTCNTVSPKHQWQKQQHATKIAVSIVTDYDAAASEVLQETINLANTCILRVKKAINSAPDEVPSGHLIKALKDLGSLSSQLSREWRQVERTKSAKDMGDKALKKELDDLYIAEGWTPPQDYDARS